MYESIGNTDYSLPRRSSYPWDLEGTICGQRPQKGSHKDHASWNGEIEMSSEFILEGAGHVYGPPSWPIGVKEAPRVEEQQPPHDKIMNIECDPDREII
ncbi:hypothetical protein AYI68_g8389 [Smittium mucronatum]|uniref:Uncharacterized protein n=1 Tax=Smittium mucronatum TaxID=133383 RepID=A0A1R0GL20_9FUNG|nr:hypothetical protein AYI68_g8389 [Smittium mucronatum]